MGAPNKKCFTCKCGKSFNKSGNFKRHVNNHSSMKPHKCSQCTWSFDQKSNLVRHMKQHDDNIKLFNCKQCNKGFTTAWGLKLHARIHVELKPYKCSECEKSFRQSSHLQKHKRTHSELRPFRCNKWKYDLKKTVKECTWFEENANEECGSILLKKEETEATQESECWICLERLTDPTDMIKHVNEHCQL